MNTNGIKISSILFGLILIVASVLLLLVSAGILPPIYKSVIISWQMLLTAIGFANLFRGRSFFWGLSLMLTGGFFLVRKFDIEGLEFISENIWPIILLVAGITIIFSSIFHSIRRKKCKKENYDWCEKKEYRNLYAETNSKKYESGYIEKNYVFAGNKEKLDIKNFKGGEINCVFGGLELDLSDAQLEEGNNYLEINTVFGGVVIFLPVDWPVEIRQNHVFGNFSDNRPKPNFEIAENRKLIINVSAVFGGGEIKNK